MEKEAPAIISCLADFKLSAEFRQGKDYVRLYQREKPLREGSVPAAEFLRKEEQQVGEACGEENCRDGEEPEIEVAAKERIQ